MRVCVCVCVCLYVCVLVCERLGGEGRRKSKFARGNAFAKRIRFRLWQLTRNVRLCNCENNDKVRGKWRVEVSARVEKGNKSV